MTDTPSEQTGVRERFEAWCEEFGHEVTRNMRNPQEYRWRYVELAWQSWQAAEAAGFARGLEEAAKANCIHCRGESHTIWDGKMHPYDHGDVNAVPVFMAEQYVSNHGEISAGYYHRTKYGEIRDCESSGVWRLIALAPNGKAQEHEHQGS